MSAAKLEKGKRYWLDKSCDVSGVFCGTKNNIIFKDVEGVGYSSEVHKTHGKVVGFVYNKEFSLKL